MRTLSYGEIKDWLIVHDKSKSVSATNEGLGLLAVLTILGLGANPAIIALAGDFLTIKSELRNITTKLLSWFNRDTQGSPSDRIQRMRVAYGLLACSAFLEAVERLMPDVMTAFQLTEQDGTRLVNTAKEIIRRRQEPDIRELSGDLWNLPLLPFPHPTDDWDQQQRELSDLYEALAVGLAAFLPCLNHWDGMGVTAKDSLISDCGKVPSESLNCFELQYTLLEADCHEFRVWARRQEYVAEQRGLDRGMRQLEQTIKSLYGFLRQQEGEEISSTLRNRYRTHVTKSILRERELSDDLPPGVALPLKSDAFIPQYFKAMRYELGTPIGSEELWDRLARREDLPDFLWSYINSPYSEFYPLIILGHPGSGKSLLTEILSARLADSPFTPLRIILRDVSADARIRQQIDEQLSHDLDSQARWSYLLYRSNAHPIVLIFDGYDELIQASGQVFANYIMDLQEFQQNEKDRTQAGVRIIVTSRSTLIDKARIPKGATVLRLLPFDEEQRGKWIDTWNATNLSGFREHGIAPFTVPSNVAVLDLAEQPLLLLMLAIYDSYGNRLREQKHFSRISLYSELISLFIHRECHKIQAFRDLPDDKQSSVLDQQRRRLGVCALGMFNRERLSITRQELENDLVKFGLSLLNNVENQSLGDADSLFGSFFFIHRSQAKESDGLNAHVRKVAYEFLHNTFGEYLCAEFLFQRVFKLVEEIATMRIPRLATYRERLLDDPNELKDDWYGCWISTPLSTRPVIVEMIQEIAQSEYNDEAALSLGWSERLRELDTLIHNHLSSIIGGHTIPSAMLGLHLWSQVPLPILSRIAVYTLNLVIIRCAMHQHGYYIAFSHLANYFGGQHPWDRLVYFWLATIPDSSRWSISGLLSVRKTEDGVHLTLRQNFDTAIAGSSTKAFTSLDLSIAKELKEEIEAFINIFYASTSHQLRNHLTTLRLMTREIIDLNQSPDNKIMRRLDTELKRFDQVLGSLLDIGHIVSDRNIRMKPVPTSLRDVLISVAQMFAIAAEKAGVLIQTKCSKELDFSVDRKLLEQALANIVQNAVQASKKGKTVFIEGGLGESGSVVIIVRDQGHGMRKEDLSRVFNAFFTTKESGTGLGLYITKKILESLGGTIELESTFSEGTTVKLTLTRTAELDRADV